MIKKFIDIFAPSNESIETNREHTRRSCDICVGVVNGITVPVENWSTGGVLLSCDEKSYGLGNVLDVTMKFKVSNDIIDVPTKAKVVRKSNGHVALRFENVTKNIKNGFQKVIDDFSASEFANSQMQG